MSYTPTNWETGDLFASEPLNHLENGIQNTYALIVECLSPSENYYVLNASWNEIYTAFSSGRIVMLKYKPYGVDIYCALLVTGVYYDSGTHQYVVRDSHGGMGTIYSADSEYNFPRTVGEN